MYIQPPATLSAVFGAPSSWSWTTVSFVTPPSCGSISHVTRRSGRQKLHYLNPVPIRLIHDRWIDKYTERQVSALADLKHELEETA